MRGGNVLRDDVGVRSLLAAALLALFLGVTAGCASSSGREAPSPPAHAPIGGGWVRIEIQDVASIDYPADFLELQSEEYREKAKGFYELLDESEFTLQQVGLNDLLPSALNEYRRVVFRTQYLNPGEEASRAHERYTATQEELSEAESWLVDQLLMEFEALEAAMGSQMRLVESVSLEIKELNGMFPLVHTYKRQLEDNPMVLVEAYVFWDYDRIHRLTFSCRVVDEGECRDAYDRILASFRLY